MMESELREVEHAIAYYFLHTTLPTGFIERVAPSLGRSTAAW